MTSKIEWTEDTWNPLAGCEYASEGCRGCYAARDAAGRLRNLPAYEGLTVRPPGELPRFNGVLRPLPERLDKPVRWRKPRRIFVNSMSDLFHPGVLSFMHVDRFGTEHPFLAEVFATMVRASHHHFQILTKRPQIMAAVMREPRFRLDVSACLLRDGHEVMPGGMTDPDFRWPAHLRVGASIELDKYVFRARHVRAAGAANFLSLEPLLGPLPSLDLTGIDWVIVGGESGPRARPMHPDWVRDLRDRCVAAGVPFFFKQWGEWSPTRRPGLERRGNMVHLLPDGSSYDGKSSEQWLAGTSLFRNGKKHTGREIDGRTWDEYPDG